MEMINSKKANSYAFLPRHLLLQSLGIQLILFIAFISFFILHGIGKYNEPTYGALADRSIEEKVTILHFWFALFFSSAFFSCLGSLMSYLSRKRDLTDELKQNSFVLSLHLIGAIFGVLMLLLFIGGFISGNLFPSFDEDIGDLSIYQYFHNIKEWAKLFVWTFLAGFSERLMPELLLYIAKRFSKKPKELSSLNQIREQLPLA